MNGSSRPPLRIGKSRFEIVSAGWFEFGYEYNSAAYIRLLDDASRDALFGDVDRKKFFRGFGMGPQRKDFSLPLEPPPDRVRVEDSHAGARIVLQRSGSDFARFDLGDVGSVLRSLGETFGLVEVVFVVEPESVFGGQIAYISISN